MSENWVDSFSASGTLGANWASSQQPTKWNDSPPTVSVTIECPCGNSVSFYLDSVVQIMETMCPCGRTISWRR